MPNPQTSSLAPFQSRIFLSIWIATLISSFGMQIHTMAAAWLMASLEPSPLMVALIQVAAATPFIFFALLAGTLSDIYDKRRLMLAAQTLGFISSALLAYFAMTGSINSWGLLILIFAISTGMAFYVPVWQSSLSLQVPKHHLAEAVGLNVTSFNLARSLSPAIGGILLTSIGAAWAFTANTLSYIGIIVVIALWKMPTNKSDIREPVLRAMGLGFRYVLLTSYIRVVIMRVLLGGINAAIFWALMPVIARDQLNGDATTYSIILFAFGIGSVVGGIANRWVRSKVGNQMTTLISQLLIGLTALLCGLSHTLWITFVLIFISGVAWMGFITILNTSIQLSAPKWIVGRVLATFQTCVFGSLALGSLAWGQVASKFGIADALMVAGVLCIISCWYSLKNPLSEINSYQAETVNIQSRLPKTIKVEPGLSKVSISLIYEVASEKEEEFLAVMSKLKAVRLRMGAIEWGLFQDLDNPHSWVERFISQDWDDLKLSRSRYTEQDNEIRLAAASFDLRGRPELTRKIKHTIHRA